MRMRMHTGRVIRGGGVYAAPSWKSEELELKSEVGRARVEVGRTRVEVGRARVEVGREKRVTLLGHGTIYHAVRLHVGFAACMCTACGCLHKCIIVVVMSACTTGLKISHDKL